MDIKAEYEKCSLEHISKIKDLCSKIFDIVANNKVIIDLLNEKFNEIKSLLELGDDDFIDDEAVETDNEDDDDDFKPKKFAKKEYKSNYNSIYKKK